MGKLINCECGYVVRGETDSELLERAGRHIGADHPDLVGTLSEDQLLAMAEDEPAR